MKRKTTLMALAAAVLFASAAPAAESPWSAVARKVAEDGTVLLKNDGDVLPLAPGAKVALFGAKTLLMCGGGSAEVRMPYGVELAEGLKAAGLEVVAPDAHPQAGIVLVTRFSKEGSDRPVASFDLTADELAAIDDARRTCGKVVAVVNAGHLVNVKPLKETADALLYAWFVGQEGGAALGRIVAGEVNPSARLADTLAEKVSDWPSDQYFHAAPKRLEYGEGQDVGYRYFNAKAPEKIVYPFGYGLSYTTFSESAPEIDEAAGTVAVTVANTGARAGRHSVLWYAGGELAAYAKTRLLAPGESERLVLKPWRGAPRLEPEPADAEIEGILAKLTLEEKLNLCSAQPPAVPRGTAGVGNLPQYGIPNAQTADGPNGVRRAGFSTCFPSGAHLAQSFDDALAEEMGRAIGEEAKAQHVDILLGPGLNLHRHPLCGRNFEYFSEDPLVSGRTAAAFVRGVQSTGTAATLKHFCCNSREWHRKEYNAEIDGPTLRGIYLKAFEIAVKEGRPRCVMTAYNQVNGEPCGESAALVNGILRGDWGFDGLVMTDWRADSTIWKQVKAGTDVYMPFGYHEKVALALEKAKSGELPLAAIDASARRVLREAKKSHRYRSHDFGPVCRIAADGETVVPAKDSVGLSSTWTWFCEDPVEGWGHAGLGKDPIGKPEYVQFELDVEADGEYEVGLRACSDVKTSRFWLETPDTTTERIAIPKSEKFQDFGPVRIALRKGRTTLKVWFCVNEKLQSHSTKGAKFTRLGFRPAGMGQPLPAQEAALSAAAGEKAAQLQTFKMDKEAYVPFDAATTVTVECPDSAATQWLASHLKEWYGECAPKVVAGQLSTLNSQLSTSPEAYAATADVSGVKIAANTLAGVRWASYTLRQLAIAKRGTMKTEGMILPTLSITDAPHLAFRAVHLCWFPETRPQQIERAIRLAALLKFNYAIIEPWGTYKSEKHPWRSWPDAPMTKAETARLVALGRNLGITLIPQLNCYGHAAFSRGGQSRKHSALDLHPEYEPLFEPGGWNWCLSNPETQRVLREMIVELHENFGHPPFFHLGCDEANAMTCPECVKTPTDELVVRHIAGLNEFIKSLGARAMIWHDMFLEKKDPRWKPFVKNGGAKAPEMLDALPKDIIICDWQYSYGNMGEKRTDWPTIGYFREKGFDVAGCPWMNYNAMKPMADYIVANGGFGLIETTWHRLRGKEWEQMYMSAAHAAWGSPVSHGVSFERSLRMIGTDMKVSDYLDTGHLNNQVPHRWWGN